MCLLQWCLHHFILISVPAVKQNTAATAMAGQMACVWWRLKCVLFFYHHVCIWAFVYEVYSASQSWRLWWRGDPCDERCLYVVHTVWPNSCLSALKWVDCRGIAQTVLFRLKFFNPFTSNRKLVGEKREDHLECSRCNMGPSHVVDRYIL